MSVEYQISTSAQEEKPKVVLRLSVGVSNRVFLYANDMVLISLNGDGTLSRFGNAASRENLEAGLVFDADGRIQLRGDL